jgi:hypothetical protein
MQTKLLIAAMMFTAMFACCRPQWWPGLVSIPWGRPDSIIFRIDRSRRGIDFYTRQLPSTVQNSFAALRASP